MSIDSSITADTEQPETVDQPEKQAYSHFGLDVYSYDGAEYAVADDDDQADEAAAEYIMDGLWAFRAKFIASHCPVGLDSKCIEAIEEMQSKLCESCSPIIQALLGNNLDSFIDAAIETEGRGHFLSSQDGEENNGQDIYDGWDGKLVYRI